MATTMEVIARLSADVSDLKRGFADAERSVKGLENETTAATGRMGSVLSGLGRAGAMAFAAIGAGATAAAGFGLKIAMETETAGVAFETLLGSAEKAGSFLKDLQQFAATTPFEFPELRGAASKLLAVGLEADRVIPLMTALGDATAAMGTGSEGINRAVYALQQMKVAGKITGQDMMQLANAGIPAWDALAAHVGMTVAETKDAVSNGKIEVESLYKALETSAGTAMQRTSGMMEVQATTLSGLVSTLKDNVSMALGDMMGPAVKSIKASLPQFTDAITAAMNAVGPQISVLATGIVDLVGSLLPTIAPLVGSIAGLIGSTFTAIKPVIEKLAPAFPALAEAVAALAEAFMPLIVMLADDFADVLILAAGGLAVLARFLADNKGIIKALAPVVVAAVGAFVAFKSALAIGSMLTKIRGAVLALNAAFAANPIGIVIAAIAALVAGIIYAYKNFEGFRKVVDSIWQFLQRLWDWITGFFVTVWHTVVAAWQTAWDTMKGVVSAVWEAIKTVVMTYINIVVGYYKLLWEAWQVVWSAIKAAFDAVWSVISAAVQAGISAVVAVFDTLRTAWQVVWTGIKAVFDLVWAGIKMVIDGWANIFRGVFDLVSKAWNVLWDGIKRVFTTIWDAIKLAVDTGVAAIKRVWDTLTGAFSGVWNGIKSAFNIVWDFIKSAVDTGVTKIKGAVETLTGVFTRVWDGIKSTVRTAINGIIDLWNRIDFGIHVQAPSWLGGFGFHIDDIFPDIPRLATGGLVTGPMVSMVGEAGREAVLPLTRPAVMADIAQAITRQMPAGSGMGSPTFNINIDAPGGDPRAIEEAVRSGIDSAFRQLTREMAVL